MDNTQVKQDIDNVNINIETPSDDSDIDLQALERDNWGRVLNNKTFKVMKENFRLIKTSFNNFISNVSNEINTLVNKTNTIENNVNTIQTTVNELKVNGGKINESTLSTLANKETVNTFKEVNTFEKGIDSTLYKLNTNELANMQGETITIGDITKSINIIGKDTTLLYNGMEIKGGGSSGGDSGSDFFIGEYPLSTTIKRDSNDKPYLNIDYNTGGFNTVNGAWRFQADVKKGVKNLSTKNSSVAFYGETLAGIIDSDGSTTQNYFELCSVEFNDFLKSIFGVSTMNDKIVIEKLCGLKFKFTLDVSQIKDTDSINLKYSYTRQSSISNYESVNEFEFLVDNEYGFMLNNLVSSSLNRNNIFLDETINNKVKSIVLDYNNITSQFFFRVYFYGSAFKDLYNSGNKINVVVNVYDIRILKIEQAGGGSSGGVGNINLSGTLGVPVIAETYSRLSLPTLTIKKNEVLNAIVYTKESDYLKILNGEIKIPSLEFNRDANGYNQDTPLVKFNKWDGDTSNNYFIPNNQTSNLHEVINQILNENISSLVPFNNIYGISFDIKTTITKNMSDGTKKVFEGVIPFRIKFKKDNATDLTSLKSNRNNFEHIYSTGYNYGDFLKLLDFNKVENSSSRSELCFKMNLSGARNNLSSYNTISKITTYSDTYTVFYITNTRDLFEGDFTTVKIEFEVNNAKVLLKI